MSSMSKLTSFIAIYYDWEEDIGDEYGEEEAKFLETEVAKESSMCT